MARIFRWVGLGLLILLIGLGLYRANDRYERGMLYPWVEALVMPENPYDGVYVIDPALLDQEPLKGNILATRARGIEEPRIMIDRYRLRTVGYLIDTPVSFNSAEICLDRAKMRMYFSRRISGYCRSEDIGENLGFTLEARGDGRLTCIDCNTAAMPLNWIRIGDLP
ncbi:hypothetical protein [Cognatiyoonia koreensis]|uniref:hypothetical protein n=1 Tax=Cognatiyoonia koreensis TaxID=364200 RepID=UPI000B7D5DA5|nr:hypothetical protein [Cognatiyoonia koreensis]